MSSAFGVQVGRLALLVLLVAAASTVALAGGGFWITTYSGRAPIAANIPDAALVVAAEGCASRTAVTMTGTAEGLVDGKRQSVPLSFTPTSKPGFFAVKKQWPSEGAWVLVITARDLGRSTSALIEPGPNGQAKILSPRSFAPQHVPAAEIESALQRLAARLNATT